MTAPTPSGERPTVRTLVPLPALTTVVSVAAVAGAVAAAPAPVRTPLAWGAGLAAAVLVVVVFLAVRATQTARLLRHRLHTVTQDAERLAQERHRTAEEAQRERQRLTGELARQHAEFSQSFAHERARVEEAAAHGLDQVRQENARLAGELERATRARDAAVSATSNAAGRMQALTTAMLADLRAMEERHTDEEVLADLLHLDHRTAQAGRLADSVAVLTGARSGRRWARPIPVESILRGAMGRISAYRRVRVHAAGETAVAGHAAEGVMHALAELLDNAANFSPPTSEVHVYVEEVPAGLIVSVEDSGLVMGEVQLNRAERAVSGDVTELGGLTGTRLGLAVVGRLARKYGLKVSFRPSARGGTGVLVLVPQDILTSPAPAGPRPADAPPKDRAERGGDGPRALPAAPGAGTAPPATGPAPTGPAPAYGTPADATAPAYGTAGADTPAPGHDDASAATPAGAYGTTPSATTASPYGTTPAPAYGATPADTPPGAYGTTPSATPSPEHGLSPDGTDGDTAERPGGLPRRRRGRTLAAAERARSATRTPAPRGTSGDDVKARAARFGSFRQAVRATTSEPTAPPEAAAPRPDTDGDAASPAAPAGPPSHPHAHPEGDPTS
ncbi:ATP-binding protein [Streptomyces sp. NPDC047017]|uniref:sensor histidine kinase n=1 Tax=Streptomyces sp. NPDC047017 TaxID=3155024 RepID=UPI0033F35802